MDSSLIANLVYSMSKSSLKLLALGCLFSMMHTTTSWAASDDHVCKDLLVEPLAFLQVDSNKTDRDLNGIIAGLASDERIQNIASRLQDNSKPFTNPEKAYLAKLMAADPVNVLGNTGKVIVFGPLLQSDDSNRIPVEVECTPWEIFVKAKVTVNSQNSKTMAGSVWRPILIVSVHARKSPLTLNIDWIGHRADGAEIKSFEYDNWHVKKKISFN